MRITGIDHVILPVSDVATAGAPFERLGLTLTPPMRHGGGATENRVFFVGSPAGEVYVELLSVLASAGNHGDGDGLERHGNNDHPAAGPGPAARGLGHGGLARLVLVVDDADAAVAALASRGTEASARQVHRADTSLIGTVVDVASGALGCPIGLIAYAESAAARRERHEAAGLFRHALPLRRLDHLAVISHDLGAVEEAWAKVLGLAVVGEVRGRGMVIRQVAVGDAIVELIGPDGPTSPVHERLGGLASVTAFEVADLDGAVAIARANGFALAEPAPGVLPNSRVSVVSPDQLGGLALQLIEFDRPA